MVGEDLQSSSSFLLDTGIIVRYLRKNRRAADLLEYLESVGEISVSAITFMEILVGCRANEEQVTTLFFDRVPPASIDREVAQRAASLIRDHPTVFGKGNPRGFPDALIAGTALAQESILVTLNTRHFAREPIQGLTVRAIDQTANNWVNDLKT